MPSLGCGLLTVKYGSLGRVLTRDIFFACAPCKKHHVAASTLSHHDGLRRTVRNQLTPQKPLQISNFRHRTIHGHIRDNNIPGAIASIHCIVGDRIPQPPCQFCYIFRRGMVCWKFNVFPIGKIIEWQFHLFYQSRSPPPELCCLLLLQLPPCCPVTYELLQGVT